MEHAVPAPLEVGRRPGGPARSPARGRSPAGPRRSRGGPAPRPRSCRRRAAGSAAARRSASRSSRGRRPRPRGSGRAGRCQEASAAGLVHVAAEVDRPPPPWPSAAGEVEVGGRVVGGVAAEDDERLHLAALRSPPASSARPAGRRQERVHRLVIARPWSRRCRAPRSARARRRGRRRLPRPGEDQRTRPGCASRSAARARRNAGGTPRHRRPPGGASSARPGALQLGERARRRRPGPGARAGAGDGRRWRPVTESRASTAQSRFIPSAGDATRRPARSRGCVGSSPGRRAGSRRRSRGCTRASSRSVHRAASGRPAARAVPVEGVLVPRPASQDHEPRPGVAPCGTPRRDGRAWARRTAARGPRDPRRRPRRGSSRALATR